jgi:hypothetical protein
MAYALDITHPRVQNAMATLGIEDSEMLIKYPSLRSLDDFAAPHVSADIQNLRFTYHRKKLAETIKKIKYQIREDRQRKATTGESLTVKALKSPSGVSLSHFTRSASLADFLQLEQQKLTQAKQKYKQRILTVLDKSLPNPTKLVKPEPTGSLEESRLDEQLQKRHDEIEQRRQRHAQKLEEIQKNREEVQRQMFRNITKSMREHEARGRKLEEEKKSLIRARAKSFQEKQLEIQRKLSERELEIENNLQEKLAEIEDKISKNRKLHLEIVREKAEKASKSLEKSEVKSGQFGSVKASEELERIKQYISAQQQAKARKYEITSVQLSKFEESRKKAEEKMAHIRELQLKEKQEEDKQKRRLEKKMNTASQVLATKQRDWARELELRLEMQRLMDEDKRSKVERAQRRFVGVM